MLRYSKVPKMYKMFQITIKFECNWLIVWLSVHTNVKFHFGNFFLKLSPDANWSLGVMPITVHAMWIQYQTPEFDITVQ